MFLGYLFPWGKSNWYDPDANQATNLASLRKILRDTYIDYDQNGKRKQFYKVFKDKQEQTDKTEGLEYDAKDSPQSHTASETA